MKSIYCVTFLFAASLQNVLAESADVTRTPIVQLANGKVRGIVRNVNHHPQSVHFYQGIRYGHAKRFEKPTPVEPWPDVYEADFYRDACPHFGQILYGASMDRTKTQSEDCLYLNVWRPANDEKHPRSVMVWIHGGGFQFGSIFEQFPDMSYWALQGNVVMVEISYRLGGFGFLTGAGVPANLAIHDQILALKWVQQNIHHFSGDPKKVTIFGQSAGSMSVGIMMLSPLATGLFHRAIMQSGAPTAEPAFMVSPIGAELKTKHFAIHLNCTTIDKMNDIITCLASKSTAEF